MATNLLPFRPAMVGPYAASGSAKPDPNRRRPSSSASPSWWSPLFGWSSEPDYIGTENGTEDVNQDKKVSRSEVDLDAKQARSRFSPGCFTEEKAKQLRMLTTETSSFHDVMYHSAIASRLASDFKHRSGGL